MARANLFLENPAQPIRIATRRRSRIASGPRLFTAPGVLVVRMLPVLEARRFFLDGFIFVLKPTGGAGRQTAWRGR